MTDLEREAAHERDFRRNGDSADGIGDATGCAIGHHDGVDLLDRLQSLVLTGIDDGVSG
ncbi:hypothetical protein ACFQYP_42620 [Nonomuraea antimicrobica]